MARKRTNPPDRDGNGDPGGSLPGNETVPEAKGPANPNEITNCQPGTTLHLGDGRKLAFGESAEVPAELAAQLRESGQAK